MTLSMYQASIPVHVRGLTNLAAILAKAENYAATKKIEPSVLVNERLYPDMYSVSRQVQIACDVAKGCAARLAGVEVPSFPDTETTFAELQQRIQKTIAFIQSVKPESIDNSEDRTVSLRVGGKEMTFKGQPYLLHFVMPNFYFHISTAYAILRHNGVELGKADFNGQL